MFSYMRQGKDFYRNMFRLALPIILQNLVTTSLALVDTFMVGMLGEGPLAGVTNANTPIFVVLLLIFGVQSGSTVLISQYWGRRDEDAINRVLGVGLYVAGILSTLFALLLCFWSEPFMALFCNDPEVAAYAAQYGRIVGFSYAFNAVTQVYIAAQRSMGNPKLGLGVLSISMCANTFLNWVLIFGNLGAPALGVEGAAIATLCSRIIEFAVTVAYALGNKRFKLRLSAVFRPGMATLRRFAKYATPVVLNETLWGLGASLYPTIMGHMEGAKEILAAYAVAGNVEKVCTVAVMAVAATTAIIIGETVGAGETQRARELGKVTNTVAFLMGAVFGALAIGLVHLVVAPLVYPLFKLSPSASRIATMMLTVTFLTLPLQGFNTTNVVGVLRGGGDVTAAAAIDLAPMWIVGVPMAAVVGLVWRLDVLWVCVMRSVEQLVRAALGVFRLHSGKWVRDVTRKEL